MSSASTVEEGQDRHEIEGRETLRGDSTSSARADEGLIYGRGGRECSKVELESGATALMKMR